MYLIYRKSTGEVVEKSGTNSMWPEGPPDVLIWAGRDRTGLVLVRLDDNKQAALVQQVLTHQVAFVDGRLTVGAPITVEPSEPVVSEFEQYKAMVDWLFLYVTTGEG